MTFSNSQISKLHVVPLLNNNDNGYFVTEDRATNHHKELFSYAIQKH